MTTQQYTDQDALREQVRARYAAAATKVTAGAGDCGCGQPADCGCDSGCCGTAATAEEPGFGAELYAALDRDQLPGPAVLASLGCGNPTAVAELHEGETVLDLGSGGGIDVLLSAKRVGASGKAYGLDMTEEMLALARANAAEAAATNVEFLKGQIEAIPLPAETIDVVISNCVVNLSTDKPAVFAETFRVLKPGGRIGITDVVAEDHLSAEGRAERGPWVGCIAGALTRTEYEAGLTAAGFADISVSFTHPVGDGLHSAIIKATRPADAPSTGAVATAPVASSRWCSSPAAADLTPASARTSGKPRPGVKTSTSDPTLSSLRLAIWIVVDLLLKEHPMSPSNDIHLYSIEDPDAAPSARTGLPVVVIGAGPVGLAAATHLLDRGLEPLVLEAGSQVGANIAQWRHVRLFSPWCLALDPVSVRLLDQAGWTGRDPDALPTGADLLERYLEPLAAVPSLASRIRLHTTVVAVARQDLDKVRSPGRDQLPFQVRVRDRDGRLADLQARAVIDASGTWTQPNPLGASGLPALGEPDAGARITYGLPDIGGRDHDRYAGRRTVVVGAGHSAATSLLALADLQEQAPGTEVVWAVRSATPRPLVGKGSAEADELPARGRLATDLAALVEDGRIELFSGFRIHRVQPAGDRVRLAGDHFHGDDVLQGQDLAVEADEVIAATGFRPDHGIAAELRLALEPGLECAAALGPIIDPNMHTCGTVPAHGIAELAHPEPGYVIVGMKSYGRAPTFLLATGYQQVRSMVAALVGDEAGAVHRDMGPPAAAICAINRDLLASVQRRRQLVPSVPTASSGTTAALGRTAADWSAASCCP